ncbi:hypothetical protein DLAC_11818 [Tieghemostelium lacteum]|uniref:Transmembrane protein n=1 Tax=Tieghemostelium lacteum TaxID=361077 RepID=A0A151Z4S9_TIELA|nr:hypothetical protein DLAC_11818 [Tieghemostelium lacteum]|eukprot:KYQ88972.1 hypothetical protein DLAC_11818 [Tieghemostelium lacteum]
MWPTISSFLIYRLYGSSLSVVVSFIEETIPGLGIIPTATLCCLNERYNFISLIEDRFPYLKKFTTIKSTIQTVIHYLKYLIYIVLSFIAYKLINYLFGSPHQDTNIK